MELKEISERCMDVMEDVLKKKVESVVSLTKDGKEWKGTVEALERRAVPDTQDLLGRYEVALSEDGELLRYEQVTTRLRVPPYGVEREEAI